MALPNSEFARWEAATSSSCATVGSKSISAGAIIVSRKKRAAPRNRQKWIRHEADSRRTEAHLSGPIYCAGKSGERPNLVGARPPFFSTLDKTRRHRGGSRL